MFELCSFLNLLAWNPVMQNKCTRDTCTFSN